MMNARPHYTSPFSSNSVVGSAFWIIQAHSMQVTKYGVPFCSGAVVLVSCAFMAIKVKPAREGDGGSATTIPRQNGISFAPLAAGCGACVACVVGPGSTVVVCWAGCRATCVSRTRCPGRSDGGDKQLDKAGAVCAFQILPFKFEEFGLHMGPGALDQAPPPPPREDRHRIDPWSCSKQLQPGEPAFVT